MHRRGCSLHPLVPTFLDAGVETFHYTDLLTSIALIDRMKPSSVHIFGSLTTCRSVQIIFREFTTSRSVLFHIAAGHRRAALVHFVGEASSVINWVVYEDSIVLGLINVAATLQPLSYFIDVAVIPCNRFGLHQFLLVVAFLLVISK